MGYIDTENMIICLIKAKVRDRHELQMSLYSVLQATCSTLKIKFSL